MKNKNKNSLTKNYFFRAYEISAVKEMLEEMALKGWRMTELRGGDFRFEKIEPQKLTYLIELVKKKSTPFMEQPDEEGDIVAINKDLGWEYLCENEIVMIFVSDEENTPPERTDARQKFKNINSSMANNFLGLWYFPLFAFLFVRVEMKSFRHFITSNFSQILGVVLCLVAVSVIGELLLYCSWYFSSRFSLKKNGYLKDLSVKYLKTISVLFAVLITPQFILGFIAFWGLTFEYKSSSLFIATCAFSVLTIMF